MKRIVVVRLVMVIAVIFASACEPSQARQVERDSSAPPTCSSTSGSGRSLAAVDAQQPLAQVGGCKRR